MKKALKRIVILPIAAVFLYFILFPAEIFGATVKARHILSVYSDNTGDNPVRLKEPEGVACGEDFFIVADSGNGRLLRYTLNDGKISAEEEIKTFQLKYPMKIQINSKGDIYVLDGRERRIVHLGPDGKFKNYVDPGGVSPPGFVPKSFALDKDDNVYILDILSSRVVVLTPEEEFKTEIKFPANHGFFSDVTVDVKGNILLLDSTNAMVVSMNKRAAGFTPFKGNLREYIRFPSNFTTDDRGRIYLVDRNGSRIIVLGQDGSYLGRISAMGWKEGLLNHPSQACLNVKGGLFITDTSNSRVQIFELLR